MADVIITATLIVKLRKGIGKGFHSIDNVIGKLIKTTLQTGLLTTVFAVIDLILYLSSTTTIDMVFNFPLANLYMISLLSTLNARFVLRNGKAAYNGTGTNIGTGSGTGPCTACLEKGRNGTTQRPNSSYMDQGLPRPLLSSTDVDEKGDPLDAITPALSSEPESPF